MIVLDLLWLGVVTKTLYQQSIGHLMSDRPRLGAALAFYALYPAGLLIFALAPQADDPAWGRILVMGVLFGVCCSASLPTLPTTSATLRRCGNGRCA